MYVQVITTPGAKKQKVEEKSENCYEISVKEPAKQNLANQKVQEILAELYEVEFKQVKIVSGHRSPKKIYSVNKK